MPDLGVEWLTEATEAQTNQSTFLLADPLTPPVNLQIPSRRGGSVAGPMLGIKWQKMAWERACEASPSSRPRKPWKPWKVGRLPILDSYKRPNVLWLDSAHSELPPRFARLHGAPYSSHLLIIIVVSRVGQTVVIMRLAARRHDHHPKEVIIFYLLPLITMTPPSFSTIIIPKARGPHSIGTITISTTRFRACPNTWFQQRPGRSTPPSQLPYSCMHDQTSLIPIRRALMTHEQSCTANR